MHFEHGVMGMFNTGTNIKGWISEMGSTEVKNVRLQSETHRRKLIPWTENLVALKWKKTITNFVSPILSCHHSTAKANIIFSI